MKTDIILISVHPEYVEKILNGSKKWEYRKKIPGEIDTMLIYATAPVCKIVAAVEVDYVLIAPKDVVWDKTHRDGGISGGEYDRYFKGCKYATAVRFWQVARLKPVPLSWIKPGLKAPQNFMYIDVPYEKIDRILEKSFYPFD